MLRDLINDKLCAQGVDGTDALLDDVVGIGAMEVLSDMTLEFRSQLPALPVTTGFIECVLDLSTALGMRRELPDVPNN
jgi:hypothetical protein